ncbi:MAG TPA: hypothetical protein VE988_01705 [Gemmataceae bacterium]|nr:hypothetical protein [Gemmataceae bacterium]
MKKSKSQIKWLVLLFAFSMFGNGIDAASSEEAPSAWVSPGSNGKLIYKTTPAGDKIMDFSHAGYMGGGVALPNVPVKQTVQPSGKDDTARIQAAIDAVSALPVKDGFRGTVLLAPGTFTCSGTIKIAASGVVLRGSGSGADKGKKSTIMLTGKPHNAIAVSGKGEAVDAKGFKEIKTIIADKYVPSGAVMFTVADAKGFAVGDVIAIKKQVTENWVKFMGMHDLVRDGKKQTWIAVGKMLTTERYIAAIAGNKITLDVPLSDSFDAQFAGATGTAVVKIKTPARVSQVGIEYLHIESPPQAIPHTQPHYTAIRMTGQDCWVRDVVIEETMNSVAFGGCRITAERVAVNRKALHVGSSRPAEFAPNGGQILLDRCTSNAENVWFMATGSGHAGPNVLLNCTFIGDGRAEAHQRWSTGLLYDNCNVPRGGIDFRNRGEMGSGHGWPMGWGVAWNCVAKDYTVQSPPGAVNWIIGCTGQTKQAPRPFGKGPNLPEGAKDSHGAAVTPQSLYLSQLAERLGPQALKNIGYGVEGNAK